MVDFLAEYGKRDCSNDDCFVCAIMSHGDRNIVMGTDWKPCGENELKKPIKDNKTLKGKPKIFFIQACRGELQMGGKQFQTDRAASTPRGSIGYVPDEADVFTQYSTVEGYVSFRHNIEGSWFIQSLAFVLSERGKKYDLFEIAHMVNNEVAKKSRLVSNQISSINSTLRFKVYFPTKSNKFRVEKCK